MGNEDYEELRKKLASMDPDIAKAEERLTWLRNDKETRELFEAHELARIEFNSQLSYARREGKAEAKAEIAMNMIREGLEFPLITKVTGMTMEEIEALRKNDQY